MFNHLHHRTWFPLVLVLLSLSLISFVAWSLSGVAPAMPEASKVEEPPAVSFVQYQAAAREVLGDFQAAFDADTYWEARLNLVSEIEEKLLELRVPSEGRAVHFELVSALEMIKQGLAGQTDKLSQGQERLKKVFSENLWLVE